MYITLIMLLKDMWLLWLSFDYTVIFVVYMFEMFSFFSVRGPDDVMK